MNKKISDIFLPCNYNNGVYTYKVLYNEKKVKNKIHKLKLSKHLTHDTNKSIGFEKRDYINLSFIEKYLDSYEDTIKDILSLFQIENTPYRIEFLNELEREWMRNARIIARNNSRTLDSKSYYEYIDEKRDEFCMKRQIAYSNDRVLKKVKHKD